MEYVAVWTTSDENSDTVPSAARELDLAKKLVEEMKGLGIEDARVDDKGYVYGLSLIHIFTLEENHYGYDN